MKHWNSSILILPPCNSIFKVINIVNRNLSFSNRPRAVYANTSNVRYSMMLWILFAVIGDLIDFAMERSKSPRNWRSDVWYMTFTMPISTIKKYRILPLVATEDKIRWIKWAASWENLCSGFPTKWVSNQSPQLQRLARKSKLHL